MDEGRARSGPSPPAEGRWQAGPVSLRPAVGGHQGWRRRCTGRGAYAPGRTRPREVSSVRLVSFIRQADAASHHFV